MTLPRIISTLSSALLLALLLSGCTTIDGSGAVATETRPVNGFTAIELSGPGELTITQTGTESLTIEAEDNLLPLLTSQVSNGRLVLGTQNNTSLRPTKPIKYTLTVKELSQVSISGSGRVNVPNLAGDTISIIISGSGNLQISGEVASQKVEISGSGTYLAESLNSQAATVDISGSGNALVKVDQTLDVAVSGNGSVEYIGDPLVNSRVTGGGRLTKR